MTADERRRAIDAGERAKAAEELWDTFVPDRKMGLQSPMFWVLLVLCVVLHFINEARDKSSGITAGDVEEERLRKDAMEKRLKRLEEMGLPTTDHEIGDGQQLEKTGVDMES